MATNQTIDDYLATIKDGVVLQDARTLVEIMQQVSGKEPGLWNVGTIGCGTYHYKYDSGREGDCFVIGFYPRKGKITIYLMDGTARYADLLTKLGKHTITGYCVNIKRLEDVDTAILEQLLQQSYDYITSLSAKGYITRILWQDPVDAGK